MPWSIEINPRTGVALATCTGVLTSKDAQAGARELWQHPDWPGVSAVWDFRFARLEVSPAETREAAQFVLAHQPAKPPERIAFVTDHDADFGMIRMFEVFRDHPATKVRVFRDLEPALAWAQGGARLL